MLIESKCLIEMHDNPGSVRTILQGLIMIEPYLNSDDVSIGFFYNQTNCIYIYFTFVIGPCDICSTVSNDLFSKKQEQHDI